MATDNHEKVKEGQSWSRKTRKPLRVEGQRSRTRTASRAAAIDVWWLVHESDLVAVSRRVGVSPLAIAQYALELPVSAFVADQIESALFDAAAA